LCKKVVQLWPRGGLRRTGRRYFCTLRFARRLPSFKSSPRMRSAPHRGLSLAIERMTAVVSLAMRAGVALRHRATTSRPGPAADCAGARTAVLPASGSTPRGRRARRGDERADGDVRSVGWGFRAMREARVRSTSSAGSLARRVRGQRVVVPTVTAHPALASASLTPEFIPSSSRDQALRADRISYAPAKAAKGLRVWPRKARPPRHLVKCATSTIRQSEAASR